MSGQETESSLNTPYNSAQEEPGEKNPDPSTALNFLEEAFKSNPDAFERLKPKDREVLWARSNPDRTATSQQLAKQFGTSTSGIKVIFERSVTRIWEAVDPAIREAYPLQDVLDSVKKPKSHKLGPDEEKDYVVEDGDSELWAYVQVHELSDTIVANGLLNQEEIEQLQRHFEHKLKASDVLLNKLSRALLETNPPQKKTSEETIAPAPMFVTQVDKRSRDLWNYIVFSKGLEQAIEQGLLSVGEIEDLSSFFNGSSELGVSENTIKRLALAVARLVTR